MEEKCYEIKYLRKFCKNIFIYHRFDENNEEIFSYENILKTVEEVLEYFHQHGIEKKVGVGINMPENSVEGCVLLLSILNNDCRFYGFNDSESSLNRSVKSGEIAYVFTTKPVDFKETYLCHLPKLNVLNESYFVIKLKTSTLSLTDLPLCQYSIATSGSTGESKLVHVPYKCIQPNITSLSSLLKIETSDIIFLGSPITFDPFVVELFLALANGAALLITSNKIRLSSNRLSHVLFPSKFGLKGVSILQTTPSLFRLFDKEIIRNVIFDKTNTLRCLILGGEEFPSYAEIFGWLPQSTNKLFNKRVFNIYGVTEVSCWSTIYEVNFHNPSPTECSIPLGKALDNETVLRIVDENGKVLTDDAAVGELQICSTTRYCYVPQFDQHPIRQKHSIIFRNTGDLVKRASDGNVYYLGRLNNTIKRLGKRLCLDSLSQKIENIFRKGNITNRVLCLWNGEANKLILCVEIGQTTSTVEGPLLQELLRDSLDNFEQPDSIYNLQKFPLTAHGKINRFQLIKIVNALEEKEHKTALQIFKEFLQNIMGINDGILTNNTHYVEENTTKRSKLTTNLSFSHAGGTSFQALSLATEIDSILPQSVDQPSLLDMLLDTSVTINDIMKFLSSLDERRIEVQTFSATLSLTRKLFKLVWSANLHKCVDASPSLYEENVVAVGSHSHLLLVLNANDGEEISKLTLMDRIESPVLFVTSQLAVVGCYDGFLYAFDFQQGSIKWRTNVGGIIKAKPLQISDILVVASYAEDFNLLAVSLRDVTTKWRLKVGSKGIFSSPLKVGEKLCLICTLDGTYCLLRSDDGSLVWSHQMKSPIFATPALVKCSKQSVIAIAEVRGKISICEAKSGQTISTFTADGNIFSSFAVHNQDLKHAYLIFGCYDKNVYCLNFASTSCKLSLTWKISLNAPIYSTPILLYRTKDNEPDILICATNGLMILANLKTALQHSFYNLEAEIFSTPCSASNGKRIFIGSRNNCLQAFKIQ